jgi:hypothetical protein
VVVVVLQAIRVTPPIVFFHYGSENIQKDASIRILQENSFLGVSLRDYMVISLLDILF